MMGSSPLARGLRPAALGERAQVRIIPARAGFTTTKPLPRVTNSDHPRSRGVYINNVSVLIDGGGSSPLARGLPARQAVSSHPPRIIPARAGFTRRERPHEGRIGDHPRSRGVYRTATLCSECTAGSSPLARGLRRVTYAEAACLRIIPARAGFTVPELRAEHDHEDHPRSRGVYVRCTTSSATHSGSSPLARGLLSCAWGMIPRPRIIPARAGFTCCTRSGRPSEPDHPRSRGVYRFHFHGPLSDLGSSPLARGLRLGGRVLGGRTGIIPARAGFTSVPQVRRPPPADHPRSRGVYSQHPTFPVRRNGSSPLARGLPLRILGIPTNPYSTRPRLPSLPT